MSTVYVLVLLLLSRGQLAAQAHMTSSLERCQEAAAILAAKQITALCVQVDDHEAEL